LQNTLQNLVSRVAGVNNEELTSRGIGMASAMAYTIKSIAYQFKNNETPNAVNISRNINLEKKFNNIETKDMRVTPMQTNVLNKKSNNIKKMKEEKGSIKNGIVKTYNIGKDVMKLGRYVAEGHPINNTLPNKFNSSNNKEREKSSNYGKEKPEIFNKIKEDDKDEK